MSIRRARRVLATAAVPAVTGLLVAGAGAALPAARAAQRAPALHTVATISLGSTSNIFKNIFTEAPDGAVFFSKGSVVWVQKGTSAPHVALHVSRPVLALAANTADLFVQTGLTVTEYSRTGGAKIRHWRLTSPVTPITIAGLLVVGRTLWSWTDWGTDSSGFEFARISRINTTASAVHIVDRKAYPVDVAANKSGLYFEDARGQDNIGHLVHATPTGGLQARRGPVGWPLALAGGRLNELDFHNDGHLYIDSYNPATLFRLSSARVSDSDRTFAGTGLGLLVLKEPCAHLTCAAATVSKLAANGTVSGTLTVPNAFAVLTGPKGVVVRVAGGHMSLSRIAS
jgi:hypothetical protein